MNYTLRILAWAEKELEALDSKPYQAVKAKIYQLSENPRPAGCRKLTDLPGCDCVWATIVWSTKLTIAQRQ